jgi:hypothetical protein
MIKVFFNCYLDEENCPEMANTTKKREALALAQKLTSNPVSVGEFDPDEKYLVFREEIIVDETLPEFKGWSVEDIINELKPQVKDAEYHHHSKVKVK